MGKKKDKIVIVQDTREQLPLDFSPFSDEVTVEIGTVWPGDYTIRGFEKSIAFERKSVGDLIGTLKGGYVGKDSIRRYESRFDLELEEFERHYDRAFVIVEPDAHEVIEQCARSAGGDTGGYLVSAAEQISRGWYRSAMPNVCVFGFIRSLVVEYGVHVYLAESREDAAHEIVEIAKKYLRARRHVIHRGKIAKQEQTPEEPTPVAPW